LHFPGTLFNVRFSSFYTRAHCCSVSVARAALLRFFLFTIHLAGMDLFVCFTFRGSCVCGLVLPAFLLLRSCLPHWLLLLVHAAFTCAVTALLVRFCCFGRPHVGLTPLVSPTRFVFGYRSVVRRLRFHARHHHYRWFQTPLAYVSVRFLFPFDSLAMRRWFGRDISCALPRFYLLPRVYAHLILQMRRSPYWRI
jgi:hypothetical protein